METHCSVSSRKPRQRKLILVEGNLGRRATLAVALAARHAVVTAATASEALADAAAAEFDVAVLDAAALGAALPRVVRILRGRQGKVRIIVVAGRRDFRAHHFAAMLRVDALLGRRAPTHVLLDRIAALMPGVAHRVPSDRRVGRAIDVMARDVITLLDVDALAEAIDVPRAALAEAFRVATDLTVDDYVRGVRLAVAKQLLRDTNSGVETLAALLGFADAHELARAFAALTPA